MLQCKLLCISTAQVEKVLRYTTRVHNLGHGVKHSLRFMCEGEDTNDTRTATTQVMQGQRRYLLLWGKATKAGQWTEFLFLLSLLALRFFLCRVLPSHWARLSLVPRGLMAYNEQNHQAFPDPCEAGLEQKNLEETQT